MKKRLLLLSMAIGAVGAALAVTADDVRIYINPGHGSWGPNDRPLATIPYPMLPSTGRPDTCGFYESNTNLWKGFEMRDALKRMGVKDENITMSRTANGPFPYVSGASNEYQYNKKVSVIAAEAEEGDYDMFVSIHSNALTDGSTTNYPLYIYRGTNASESVSGSKSMCQVSWPRHWMDEVDPTYCSSRTINKTNPYIVGDVTFYNGGSTSTNSASGISYYGYLGALKHGVPGFLVEGYFHTYQPARHRALNQDYCRQEGLRLARGAADYFGISGENVGYIMGSVKDAVNSLENSLYTYSSGTIDAHAPINGAVVKLYKGGTQVATYTTDNNYNGIFVFSGLAPGNDYTISVTKGGYTTLTNQGSYTVTANETTYMVLYLTADGTPVTDEKPVGIFAYDLNRTTDDNGNYVFTFKCNAQADEAYLVFTDSVSGDEAGRIALNEVTTGVNTVTLAPEELPGENGQILAWAVNVVGLPITTIQRVNSTYATYTRATMAIDRSPESAHFGTIYVGERVGKDNSGNGLYVCDVNGQPKNSTVYRGGQMLSNLWRICVDGEGKVYLPDWADASSGIFVADPDNLGESFTPFFDGTRASNGLISNNGVGVGCSVPCVWVQGTGANAKLYTVLEDIAGPSGSKNGVGVYNIGQSDGSLLASWNQAPSNYVDIGALEVNGNCNIIADNQGRGLWVAQYRSSGQNTAAVPSLVFVDEQGNVQFNSGRDLPALTGSSISGFAINNTGDLLVINDGDGVLQFYNLSWNGNIPSLTPTGTTYIADARTGTAIHQMAFDWGGNLVCAGKNIGIYSIPTDNNQSTTPARSALSVIKNEVVADTSIVKGIFAYDLNRTEADDGGYTFTFKANADARAAYIIFTDNATGQETGRVALSDVVEGENSITLTKDQLPGDEGQVMNWAVNVVGDAITRITRLNDNYANYNRATVAIDRCPESAHFGNIYVNEFKGRENEGNGIYACDVNGQPKNSTVYNGGLIWANNMRIAVDGEGKIYIPEWGDATSGIYIANPDNLEGTFTQFFVGDRDANGLITNNGESVGGSVSGLWIQGTGADTKLYAYLEDVAGPSGRKNSVGIYNIGQSDGSLLTTWDQAPSSLLDVGNTLPNSNGYIIADAGGRGTWVMEYRSVNQNKPENPSVIFVDNDGNVVYNSGRDLPTLNGSLISAMAINNNGDMMVINDGDGVLQFFNITWNGNTPVLTHNGTSYTADARTDVNAIYQMAFDWGGNLVCSGSNIGIYSIPTDNNQSTTPARSSLTITKGANYIPGDVNCDGVVNVTDVTTLIRYLMGSNPQPFDQNAANFNQDSNINVTDVTSLISYLMSLE